MGTEQILWPNHDWGNILNKPVLDKTIKMPSWLVGSLLYVPVNNYGHVGTVSLPDHIFSGQARTSGYPVLRALTFACNWQLPFLNDSAEGSGISGREENDSRNNFMINLHKIIGPGQDQLSTLDLQSDTSSKDLDKPGYLPCPISLNPSPTEPGYTLVRIQCRFSRGSALFSISLWILCINCSHAT